MTQTVCGVFWLFPASMPDCVYQPEWQPGVDMESMRMKIIKVSKSVWLNPTVNTVMLTTLFRCSIVIYFNLLYVP